MKPKLNYGKLLRKIETEKKQITFLQECGVLRTTINCEKCDNVMSDVKKHPSKKYHYFYCVPCKKMASIRTKSILSNANISLR